MTIRNFTVAAALGLAGLLGGCASYEPASGPARPELALMAAKSIGGEIEVGVTPYTTNEQQVQFFDGDLDDIGTVAMSIAVKNNGASLLTVRPEDVTLTLPDGTRYAPASAEDVALRVDESGSMIGSALAFGIIGLAVQYSAEQDAKAARTQSYRNMAFKETTLASGESADGILFFMLSEDTERPDQATMEVKATDPETKGSEAVTVQVAGLAPEEDEDDEGEIAAASSGASSR